MHLLKLNRYHLVLLIPFLLAAGCGGDGGDGDPDMTDVDAMEMEVSDPCDEVVECDAERTCQGSELVVCAADANGCLVEQNRNDCADTPFGSCNAELGQCVVDDPCEGIPNICETEGETCDGDSILRCAPNAIGCLVETRVDCSNQGATCVADDNDQVECGFDVCAGKTECNAPGRTCNGDVLEVCERDIYGCLVLNTFNCVNRGGVCDDSGEVRCTGNPCSDDPQCGGESSQSCAGTTLDICSVNEFGCLEATAANCTQTSVGQGFCDSTNAAFNQCNITFNANCEEFETCTLAGRRCDGDTLLDCSPNESACLVETATDCTETDTICVELGDEGVAQCGDPCELVETCPAEVYCDGSEVVTCVANQYGCLVEDSREDCAQSFQFCDSSLMPPACDSVPNLMGSSSPSLAINDNQTVSDTINLTGSCTVESMTVTVDISHTFKGDLEVVLNSPSGSDVVLHNRTGSGADDIMGTYPTSLTPSESLTNFSGASGSGDWELVITDNAFGDTGMLNSWSIDITCQQ